MPPVIDKKFCNFCGICYNMCPQDVFTFEKKQKQAPVIAYPQECWYCGACVVDCPKAAISLRLPLPLHIVPSPALYGSPGPEEKENLRRAADFSRSIEGEPGERVPDMSVPGARARGEHPPGESNTDQRTPAEPDANGPGPIRHDPARSGQKREDRA